MDIMWTWVQVPASLAADAPGPAMVQALVSCPPGATRLAEQVHVPRRRKKDAGSWGYRALEQGWGLGVWLPEGSYSQTQGSGEGAPCGGTSGTPVAGEGQRLVQRVGVGGEAAAGPVGRGVSLGLRSGASQRQSGS